MKKEESEVHEDLLKDPTFPLQYIGFCLAIRPSVADKVSICEFIDFAKFQLCAEYKIPRKSHIWDSYTDEEILIEYYALRFYNNADKAKDFEDKLSGDYQSDLDWFDSEIQKNKESLKSLYPDEVKFSPKDIKNGKN